MQRRRGVFKIAQGQDGCDAIRASLREGLSRSASEVVAIGKGIGVAMNAQDSGFESIKSAIRGPLLPVDINLARVRPEVNRPELQLSRMGAIEWVQTRLLSPGYGFRHPRRIAGTV